MVKLTQPIKPGSFITAIVTLIESMADADKNPLETRMAILDAVSAELIWGLGSQFDTDIIITRHGDNIATMVQQMNDFEQVFVADQEPVPPAANDTNTPEPPPEVDVPDPEEKGD